MCPDDQEKPRSRDLAATRVASRSEKEFPAVAPSDAGSGCLIVIVGPKIGVQHKLGEQAITIGRDLSCSIQVDNDLVSRQHARVEWDGSNYRISDLGSTNGTFVNDDRVSERELRDGDRISIGKAILKFLDGTNIEAVYHREIFHLMAHDGLTGIHNKRHFDEALTAAISKSKRAGTLLSLLVFDIDFFKKINDTYGHAAGDAVLRNLASAVASSVPDDCLFARVGGEEFAVICPGYDARRSAELAEHVRATIQMTRFQFAETTIPVTASVGGATRPVGEGIGHLELFRAADSQLYAAKQAGRNCVRVAWAAT